MIDLTEIKGNIEPTSSEKSEKLHLSPEGFVEKVEKEIIDKVLTDVEKVFGENYPLKVVSEGEELGIEKPERLKKVEEEMFQAAEDVKKALERTFSGRDGGS
jgi:hypothetical protein